MNSANNSERKRLFWLSLVACLVWASLLLYVAMDHLRYSLILDRVASPFLMPGDDPEEVLRRSDYLTPFFVGVAPMVAWCVAWPVAWLRRAL